MAKKSRKECRYLENKKSFNDEIGSIFYYIYRLLIAKNGLRHESEPLKNELFLQLLQMIEQVAELTSSN